MYDAMKRHEIQILKEAGLSAVQIAKKAGVSVRTVWRILNDSSPTPKDAVGRKKVAEPFSVQVQAILNNEPDLPTVEILHRVKQQGYASSKTPLFDLVARLRPVCRTPLVRFEGLAGEFSQHDFGQVRVRYEMGMTETLHFFASRLKFSRWAHVLLTPDERIESVVRGLVAGFESFGGVPLVGVFDNPKTIVIARSAPIIEWNPTFGQVALDFRFAPELCAPRRGNQKGAVERLVGWVKNSFFKVRRFHDRDDLTGQLGAWLKETNEVRPSRATGVPPMARIQEERRRLRPLAFAPNEYALRFPITVGPTAMVEYEGFRYTLPPEAIGMPGTLFLYPQRVKIVARHFVVEHPRFPENGTTCYHPEYRAAMLAKVSGERGKLYFKRQQILELGGSAETFLTELVHRRPRTWKGDVERLYAELQNHGGPALLNALRTACERGCFGAEYVSEILKEIA